MRAPESNFESYRSERICSIVLIIWTVASLKKIKRVCEFFNSELFSPRATFVQPVTSYFLILLSATFSEIEYGFLSALARKLRDTLNKRKTKFALSCSFQKVTRALAFRSREILDNPIYCNILTTV